MLYKPSVIITSLQLKDASDYGFTVYKHLLVKMDGKEQANTNLFLNTFVKEVDAIRCYESIKDRIQAAVPEGSTEEDFLVLPPMFLRSDKNEIAQITTQVMIVMCENGPVVPVVFTQNNRTLHGDEMLPNVLLRLYEVSSSQYVNLTNLEEIIEKKA